MQFTSFASMAVVVATAAFVHAGPISGATDAAASYGAGSLLLAAREPKCQIVPEYTAQPPLPEPMKNELIFLFPLSHSCCDSGTTCCGCWGCC